MGLFYSTPKPTEALIITGGFGKSDPTKPPRIVTGKGALHIPGIHRVNRFYIGAYNVAFVITAQTQEKIEIEVGANVAFRVEDTLIGIHRASSRFIDADADYISEYAQQLFEGATRSLIGGMRAADIISDRMELTVQVLDAVKSNLAEIGWKVDNFSINSISDYNNYITNLSQPELYRVQQEAEVAEAQSRIRIEDERQKAEIEISKFKKDSDLQVSQNTMETAEARARAEQSGPIAEAESRLELEKRKQALAAAAAKTREAELEAEVLAPARAEAARVRIEAEASLDAERKKAEALSTHDGVLIQEQIVSQLPAITENLAGIYRNANITFVGEERELLGAAMSVLQLLQPLRDQLVQGTAAGAGEQGAGGAGAGAGV